MSNEDTPQRRVLLRASALSAGYPSRTILRGVDMELAQGDFWFLVGSNGSGKTTLVRTVLGLLEPLGGSLTRDPSLTRSGRIGFVPQRSEIPPSVPMTVHEFVRLGLVGIRTTRAQRLERVEIALGLVGLSEFGHRGFARLSGGLRQRAVLARALVRDPELLVLDEPTNHLDQATEDAFLDLLLRLKDELGTAVMFVTHDLEVVARMATHVALFTRGTVVAGRAAEVFQEAELAPMRDRLAARQGTGGLG